MATYHVEIKSGQKGSAKAHSEYVGRRGFHRRRGDLIHSDHGNMPAWTGNDPIRFWTAADANERKNGTAFRELIVALPAELTTEQNKALARDLAEKLAPARPYQLAIHGPVSSLEGQANPHVHLMVSQRVDDGVVRPQERFFARYNPNRPELGGRKKASCGRSRTQHRDHVISERKTVADVINNHLQENGHQVRVDHRSLKDQGIDRPAERHLGPARIRSMSAEERAKYVASRPGRHEGKGGEIGT